MGEDGYLHASGDSEDGKGSIAGRANFLVLSVDPNNGNKIWGKLLDLSFTGGGDDIANNRITNGNGNIIVIGRTSPSSTAQNDVAIVKFDYSGNIISRDYYGTNASDEEGFGIKYKDGKIYATGYTNHYPNTLTNYQKYIIQNDNSQQSNPNGNVSSIELTIIIITTTSTQTTTTSSGNVILNAKVSGTEIVNLPAGKFSAFKIHVFQNVTIYYSEGDVTSRYTIIQNGTAWYSTQVKQYIKEDIISTTIAYYSNSTEQSQISYLSELKSYSIQQQITSPTTSSPTTSTTSPTSSSPTFTFTKTGSQTSSPTTILSSTPFSYSTSKQPSSPPIFTTSELTIFGLSMFNFILIIAGVIIAIALAGLLLMRRRKGAQPKEIYPTQLPPPQPPQYTPQPIQYPAQQTQAQQYQTQLQHQADVTQQAQPPQQPIPSTKVCPYCNSILPAEAKFCVVCGNPQPKKFLNLRIIFFNLY